MRIKIICLNLWLGGKLMDNILDFLSEEDADIVLLQEVFNGKDENLDRQFRSVQVLQEALGYDYSDFSPNYRDFDHTGGLAERGNAILSKSPIVDRASHYFSIPYNETYRDISGNFQNCPRSLQHTVIRMNSKNLNVFNLHGPWDLDGSAYNDQRKEMEAVILKEISGKSHIILGGDTNATPDNPAIQHINQKLSNVFSSEQKTTFNLRRKSEPGYASAVVDMLFVSSDIKILNMSVPDIDISDHLPLIANLQAY